MSFGAGGAQASQGADLEQIDTEQLHFHAISADDSLQLLPAPWPSGNLPPPWASLLSVASRRGLVAAAGADTLVIAKTQSVRDAFTAGGQESKTISFTPEASIAVPRVSHVAFSSDESCLVVVAEQGGGLAVYETDGLANQGTNPAFQISTDGRGVRQLLPNPNPASETAHLFAIVLQTGQLLLADLKTRGLAKTSGGSPVFHDNVTSACWSRLGKQIVAGRGDGTAVQIDPKGDIKAEIPIPPRVPDLAGSTGQVALMSVYWLDTNEFLLVHNPGTNGGAGGTGGDGMSDDMTPRDPIWHLARRENAKSTAWEFNTIIDPAPGLPVSERMPPHQFMQRLIKWPPHLDDLLLTISTTSTDVGMLTKCSTPLNSQTPVVGTWTTTLPLDTHRAGLPMGADGISDTSPIGMALDLSSTALIERPIPTDTEVMESPIPLPCLYVLNNEGLLRAWYIIYNASIREKTAYPDLLAAGGPRSLAQGPAGANAAAGSTTPIASPAPAAPSAPAFGAASLSSRASPWGAPSPSGPAATPAPKPPAFGSSTPLGGGGGFGQVGGIGPKASPWGAPPPAPKASAFEQPSTPGTPFRGSAANQSPFAKLLNPPTEQKPVSRPSVFGSSTEQKPASGSSVFGGGGQSVSTFGGVGANATQQKANQSAFASAFGPKPAMPGGASFASTATLGTGSSFGAGGTTPSLFGTPSQSSGGMSWGQPSKPVSREETMGGEEAAKATGEGKPVGDLFGSSGVFKLGSTFKGDGSAKDDLPKPENAGAGMFGGGFGSALGDVGKESEQPATPIKKEPGADQGLKLGDVPAAGSTTPADAPPTAKQDDPLSYKAKRFAGDLPPMDVPGDDPLAYKTKIFAGDVPPVEPANREAKAEEVPKQQDEEVPLAGSPPIDLGSERFSEVAGSEEGMPAGPEDEDDEWGTQDEDGEEDDGDDDDESVEDEDGEEEAEEELPREVTDQKGLSAFEARLHPASPKRVEREEEESTTPATERKPARTSFTPAGLPKHNVNFARPAQESPRSPSPVRSVTTPMQQKPTFGTFGPPSFPTQLPQASSFGKPSQAPASPAQPRRLAVPPSKLVERPASPVKPAEPTAGELEDEEDARVQATLARLPEPTKDLPAFLAHQDYVGESDKDGIGNQIERVYRDINSMVDTLGLNAHALQGFVDGHQQLKAEGERGEEDLEDGDWTLDEVGELGIVQDDIGERLEEGKLVGVQDVLGDVRAEQEDTLGLKAKAVELKKRIKAYTDPAQVAQQRDAPLAAEAQAQQTELRQGVQRVQALLGKVEEAMSLLRADLASAAASHARANAKSTSGSGVPTVEAVTNTIMKMTAMIQEKSGDVDVLEAQIRRLPGGIASLKLSEDYEDQLVASLTGSKLVNGSTSSPRASTSTPLGASRSRQRMLANGDAPGMSGMLGSRYRTPPSAQQNGARSTLFSPEASRLGVSTSSANGTPRRKMVDVTEAEAQAYRAKVGRRARVLGALRKEVEKRGPRPVQVE
ncbi:hypothetical protein LTR53_010245 [Teratosphaeriaceae sp. CCFEE 6253]|nr:hypothetical protein LTR53_010245 [Teratosphaeriaceae sp. CCFEE 6253]